MTGFDPPWILPSPILRLSNSDIHLWRTDLNVSLITLQHLTQILSEDERQRANRFHFERDRIHFIACRGILRCILGRYLNTNPAYIQFSYGSRGKPILETSSDISPLQFNLSHSHGLALYAITRRCAIGVDLEYCRAIEVESLAKSFFSPREYILLSALPPVQQRSAFFQLWTYKEAYLKATGKGLTDLKQVEILIHPDHSATLHSSTPGLLPSEYWCLQQLLPASNYIAAFAVAMPDWNLSCYRYESDPKVQA
ncbi:MAG: 4'-phosphopantetheinyl transferase superfamily protein [Cyanobacteria bacterium CRU_2_1]|nr:4'-phosphopantetheinyl transferase superfamily protein [Cyanobacteria bacterium CRU_2_1]